MLNEDNASYYKYTGPQRLDKAIHTLEGMIRGVAIDGRINEKEMRALTGWVGEHVEFARRHPFNEVIPRLHEILADGIIDEEEKADILWLCEKFTTDDNFFCAVSSDMQRLQGMMSGIAADGVITKDELDGLSEWMNEHEHLRTCWPYDELESLIVAVLADGKIDDEEHRCLIAFFSEFIEHPGHRSVELPSEEEAGLIAGVCAVCPQIEFADRAFCFTGKSERYTRRQFAEHVAQKGGRFCKSVVKDLDYLIIGADGNPCWAYACYGRKVEAAIERRKQGANILLIHEYDYWDAIQDS